MTDASLSAPEYPASPLVDSDWSVPAVPRFTYSHAGQSRFRRGLIRSVERLSGRETLQALYLDWARHGRVTGESVFEAALRLLDVRTEITGAAHLKQVPETGGVLLVANHPYGILDGLALGRLGMQLRGNVHILTNSLLCQVPEIAPHLLPVDFSGTPEARRLTGVTRRRAVELLAAGKVVAMFPAGGVATANAPVRGRACDAEWHPFLSRLATVPFVTTLPLYFHGQNSRLFQIASHLSYPLRVAMIFHETRRRMGLPLGLTLGSPLAAEALARLPRAEVATTLRRLTMGLAPQPHADPDEVYRWPAHVKW